MRLISLLLFVLLLAIQYPLWLGKGGWLRVWDLNRQVNEQTVHNQALKLRNAKLEGEVKDLQDGTGAIEERARYELGMVKDGKSSSSLWRRLRRSAPRRRCCRRPIPSRDAADIRLLRTILKSMRDLDCRSVAFAHSCGAVSISSESPPVRGAVRVTTPAPAGRADSHAATPVATTPSAVIQTPVCARVGVSCPRPGFGLLLAGDHMLLLAQHLLVQRCEVLPFFVSQWGGGVEPGSRRAVAGLLYISRGTGAAQPAIIAAMAMISPDSARERYVLIMSASVRQLGFGNVIDPQARVCGSAHIRNL
jgi:cell division protein FtsB